MMTHFTQRVRGVVAVEIGTAECFSDFAGPWIDLSGDPELDDRVVEFVLREVFAAAIEVLTSKRLVAPSARARGDARRQRRQPTAQPL